LNLLLLLLLFRGIIITSKIGFLQFFCWNKKTALIMELKIKGMKLSHNYF